MKFDMKHRIAHAIGQISDVEPINDYCIEAQIDFRILHDGLESFKGYKSSQKSVDLVTISQINTAEMISCVFFGSVLKPKQMNSFIELAPILVTGGTYQLYLGSTYVSTIVTSFVDASLAHMKTQLCSSKLFTLPMVRIYVKTD